MAMGLALSSAACGAGDAGAASYTLRGIVEDVSGTGPDARVTIHHEAIARFKDRDGKEGSMASMSMNFGFVPSIPRNTFVVGEKVSFVFDVRFRETPPLLITRVEKLPANTALVLADE
jgi:Cu/Ag efflux protein CusF